MDVSVVCCQVEFSASGCWSLAKGSPTKCGVSEYDLGTSTMRWPWPTRNVEQWKKTCEVETSDIFYSLSYRTDSNKEQVLDEEEEATKSTWLQTQQGARSNKVTLSGVRQSEEYCRGLENSLCHWKWYKKQRLWVGFLQNEKLYLSSINKYVLWSWKTIALHFINGSWEVTWGFRKTLHVSKRRCNTQVASAHPQVTKAFRGGIRKPHRYGQLWHASTAWKICFQ